MTTTLSTTDTAREARARRALKQQGYSLVKSRARTYSDANQQGYMIVDAQCNSVYAGEHYDMALEDVERFANE
jgi:hypothetical protein